MGAAKLVKCTKTQSDGMGFVFSSLFFLCTYSTSIHQAK